MAVTRLQIDRTKPPLFHRLRQFGAIMVEPTVGWWSGNPVFGGRFQGRLPPVVGQPVPILNIDAMPGPPRSLAIHLFRSDRQITTGGNSDVFGRVTYGAGGVTNELLVDFKTGCQFTVVANSLRLDAIPYAPIDQIAYAVNDNLILGATVGTGPTPGCSCPTLTVPFRSIGPSTNIEFPIPDHAVSYTINTSELSQADVPPLWGGLNEMLITHESLSNVNILEYHANQMFPGCCLGTGVPIQGGVNKIRIRNDRAVGAMFVGLTYHLGL